MAALSSVALHHPTARRPGSDTDVGPFINVVTWVLLITSALAVLTRLVTKRALRRRIDIDDAFVILALVASVASGVAVNIQTHNGLGRDIASLTEDELVAYRKADYANGMLYIATLGFAKLSIISLIMILTATKTHRDLGLALAVFMALWAICSIFALAFQCGTSQPWRFLDNKEKCFHIEAFWHTMGAINIATDLALIAFPVHVVMTLHMKLSKKVTVLTFFSARSLDIIATAVQIVYIRSFSSPNTTGQRWRWTLLTQITECITIVTACVPYLRPLLDSVPSGLYASDELRRRNPPSKHATSRRKSSSYQLSSLASKVGAGLASSNRQSQHTQGKGIQRFLPPFTQDKTTHANSTSGVPGGPRRLDGESGVEITGGQRRRGDDKRWETGSTESRSRILKTTVVSAEWEDVDLRGRDGSSDEIAVVR